MSDDENDEDEPAEQGDLAESEDERVPSKVDDRPSDEVLPGDEGEQKRPKLSADDLDPLGATYNTLITWSAQEKHKVLSDVSNIALALIDDTPHFLGLALSPGSPRTLQLIT